MSTLELKVIAEPRAAHVGSLKVGGDVFELMTKALYTHPLSIFREYVQNSADAIDDAVSQGKLADRAEGRIDIAVDRNRRTIVIRDNGAGIGNDKFDDRLTSLGASPKRGRRFKGFRGIGRLGGLAFAQQLTFRSRAGKDEPVRELTWDGRRLKEHLSRTDSDLSIEDLVCRIATTRVVESTDWPEHFFEVEISGVVRLGNDDLLNEEVIKTYLEQVAPLPISDSFRFKPDLDAFLSKWGVDQEYLIFLNGSEDHLVRPFANNLHVGTNILDRVLGVDFFQVPGDNGVDAVGWTLSHSYLGSIPRSEPLGGIRARVGNMQIGDRDLFADLFPQRRFNAWTVGEVHILNDLLQPNSSRDAFEINVHSQNLASHLVVLGRQIASDCRRQSNIRNAIKRCEHLLASIDTVLESLEIGLFPIEQARAIVNRDFHYFELALAKLEGAIRSEYEDKFSAIKEKITCSFEENQRSSLIDSLPKSKRTIMKKVAEVISMESPSPEFASRVISKILDA